MHLNIYLSSHCPMAVCTSFIICPFPPSLFLERCVVCHVRVVTASLIERHSIADMFGYRECLICSLHLLLSQLFSSQTLLRHRSAMQSWNCNPIENKKSNLGTVATVNPDVSFLLLNRVTGHRATGTTFTTNYGRQKSCKENKLQIKSSFNSDEVQFRKFH